MTLLLNLSIYTLDKEMLRLICVSDLCGSQRTRKHFRRSISLFQSNKTNLCCLILIFLFSSDPPNVTVSSSAEGAVVEDEDSVSLKCEVDANPEAEITWRKEGERRVLGNFPVLDIGVVSRCEVQSVACHQLIMP